MILAGPACVVEAGSTHASSVRALLAATASTILVAGEEESIRVAASIDMPLSVQLTLAGFSIERSSGSPYPEESEMTLTFGVSKQYRATRSSTTRREDALRRRRGSSDSRLFHIMHLIGSKGQAPVGPIRIER